MLYTRNIFRNGLKKTVSRGIFQNLINPTYLSEKTVEIHPHYKLQITTTNKQLTREMSNAPEQANWLSYVIISILSGN